jgi:predicted NUDIX family NTP pyrophosphohydrolase
MSQVSAGIMLYRKKNNKLEIFLVHPGGPIFANKDDGWWSIPKGLVNKNEELLDTALRELYEETYTKLSRNDQLIELGSVKQKSGKIVYAWAKEYNENVKINTDTNVIRFEWPYKSSKFITIPENDRGEWFEVETAKQKINQAQAEFINKLAAEVEL